MPTKNKKSKAKGVGFYIYPVRVFGYLLAIVGILAFYYVFRVETHTALSVYTFSGILLIYPHIAFLYYRYKNYDRKAEFHILLFDMFLIAWINYFVEFSPIYGLPFFISNSATNFATNGFRFFYKSTTVFALGILSYSIIFGFDLHYEYNFWVSIPGFIYLILATHYIGFISYSKGRKIHRSKQLLEEKNVLLMKNRDEITNKNQALEQANFNIKESIDYVYLIQEAILASQESVKEIFPKSMILHQPRDVVSGDFYWVHTYKQWKILVVADCTGHGIPGAFMSLIGQMFLNKIILEDNILQPDKILKLLHQKITVFLNQKSTNNRDGMDMAILSINMIEKVAQFSGAKQPLLIICGNKLQKIKGSLFSIGGENYKKAVVFDLHTFRIEKNMRFYIYSDGFQDQFGGEKRKKLGAKYFRELLLETQTDNIQDQKTLLNNFLLDWMQNSGEKQVDDILVFGIEL